MEEKNSKKITVEYISSMPNSIQTKIVIYVFDNGEGPKVSVIKQNPGDNNIKIIVREETVTLSL
jgi:hypothetical protein